MKKGKEITNNVTQETFSLRVRRDEDILGKAYRSFLVTGVFPFSKFSCWSSGVPLLLTLYNIYYIPHIYMRTFSLNHNLILRRASPLPT